MVTVLDTTLREGELQPGVYFNCKSRKEIGRALAEIGTRRIEFPIAYSPRGGRIEDIRYAIEEVKKSSNDLQTILQCRACDDDVKNASQYGADGCAVFLSLIHISEPTRPY